MGWTTIETPQAKYVVIFEAHAREAKIPNEEFDGIIL